MLGKFRFRSFYFGLIAISVFATTVVHAQNDGKPSLYTHEDAYEDGYDDGYADAMEDCEDCPIIRPNWSGFYIGVNGGYQNYDLKNQFFLDDNQISRTDLNAKGWVGNLFVGYGKVFPNRFYLGGEGYVGTTNAEGTSSVDLFGVTAKVQYSAGTTYGLTFTPGYQLPAGPLVYGRLGVTKTEFDTRAWTSGLFMSSFHDDVWRCGFAYGVGASTPVYKQFSMRFDYDHINYRSFSNGVDGLSTKITPSDDRFTIGGAYNFRF